MRGTVLRFFTAIPPAGPLLPMSAERRVALVSYRPEMDEMTPWDPPGRPLCGHFVPTGTI